MLIGYIRLSEFEKTSLDECETVLMRQGVRKIFHDVVKDKENYRPGLKSLFNYLREGDIVVVESFSRMAKGIRDLLFIVQEIKEKRADVLSLKEEFDTTTTQGFMALELLIKMSEYEKQMSKNRQIEGYFDAVKDGKMPGRKAADIDVELFNKLEEEFKEGLITRRKMVQKLGICATTIRKYEKLREEAVTLQEGQK